MVNGGAGPSVAAHRFARRSCIRLGARQQYLKRGALAQLAVKMDRAAENPHNPLDDRKPEAAARGLVVKNGSNTLACVSGDMPSPVSETTSFRYSLSGIAGAVPGVLT